MFLKILQYSQENTCVRVSFFNKVETCDVIKKETLGHVFSWEICKNVKITFSCKTLPVAASLEMLTNSFFKVPGNHDFDGGPTETLNYYNQTIKNVKTKVVSSNMVISGSDPLSDIINANLVLNVSNEMIGICGYTIRSTKQ